MTLLEERLAAPDHDDPLVPVFVYGTLRIGEGNWLWARSAVRHEVSDVRASGRLYFVSGQWGFPVAKLDEAGIIVGDVLWFDPAHPAYDDVMEMEIGAGYECREIEVTTSDDSERIDCIAFHYQGLPRGELIKDGDWKAANERSR